MAREDGKIFTRTLAGSNKGAHSGSWRIIKPSVSKGGYEFFRMNGRRGTNKYVHRIIASLFHGQKDSLDVNHRNCIKTDNRAENLEWVTRKENIIHARENGLLRPSKRLSIDQVRVIWGMLKQGIRPVDVHRKTGLPSHCIYAIHEGKLYKRDIGFIKQD